MIEKKFIHLEDYNIFYELSGKGKSIILFIHSAVGSANDFSLQLGGNLLNEDDFTLIAFDLPGCGRSERILSNDEENKSGNKSGQREKVSLDCYLPFCAKIAFKLMSALKFKTYSVCGWDEGAKIASLLAINYPSRVNYLLLWSFVPHLDKHSCEAIARTRDTGTWNKESLKFYTDIYGERKFSQLWKEYVDSNLIRLESEKPFELRKQLNQIKCPTMILYGCLDHIVDYNLHVEPLRMEINDLHTVVLPDLSHNLHQQDPIRFNSLLNTLLENV